MRVDRYRTFGLYIKCDFRWFYSKGGSATLPGDERRKGGLGMGKKYQWDMTVEKQISSGKSGSDKADLYRGHGYQKSILSSCRHPRVRCRAVDRTFRSAVG